MSTTAVPDVNAVIVTRKNFARVPDKQNIPTPVVVVTSVAIAVWVDALAVVETKSVPLLDAWKVIVPTNVPVT